MTQSLPAPRLCKRIDAGRPHAHVADEGGISRATLTKWYKRWLLHGDPGLLDRTSRPDYQPTRTPDDIEEAAAVRWQGRPRGRAARSRGRLGSGQGLLPGPCRTAGPNGSVPLRGKHEQGAAQKAGCSSTICVTDRAPRRFARGRHGRDLVRRVPYPSLGMNCRSVSQSSADGKEGPRRSAP